MKKAADILTEFGVDYKAYIISAHRAGALLKQTVEQVEKEGCQVIIAGAGLAAALPGVIAGITTLPVIGVPCKGGAVDGIDALLSTVQMPTGIPVATVALNGGAKAALLAAQILAVSDDELARKLDEKRVSDAKTVLEKDASIMERL